MMNVFEPPRHVLCHVMELAFLSMTRARLRESISPEEIMYISFRNSNKSFGQRLHYIKIFTPVVHEVLYGLGGEMVNRKDFFWQWRISLSAHRARRVRTNEGDVSFNLISIIWWFWLVKQTNKQTHYGVYFPFFRECLNPLCLYLLKSNRRVVTLSCAGFIK